MTEPMDRFRFLTLTPAGRPEPSLAIAACRAGGLGVLNLEYAQDGPEARAAISRLAELARADFGIKINGADLPFLQAITASRPANLTHVVISSIPPDKLDMALSVLAGRGFTLLLECTSVAEARGAEEKHLHGVIAKGQEAGGRIGSETTFILLQRLVKDLTLPVYAQGGIGLHTVAACYAAGAAGVVLEAQLALTRESPLHEAVQEQIKRFDGSETTCLGEEIGEAHRVCSRFGAGAIRDLRKMAQGLDLGAPAGEEARAAWREAVAARVGWSSAEGHLFPWGQDIALAASLAAKFVTVGGIIQALRDAVAHHIRSARQSRPLAADSPLARSHRTCYPIVQGPMARVSDNPAFALAVAQAGALPFVAAAWMQRDELQTLLQETRALLGAKPWGVGLLGFLAPEHYRDQITAVLAHRPPFALIAGGHPEQVKELEQAGIATYVHAPSAGLLRMFVERGLRRLVLEGRESGGHIGPLSSFMLWELGVEALLDAQRSHPQTADCQVLFAGGIHDGRSAAMVAALAAPLAEAGVKVGLQLGSAYLFTQEAVDSGALTPTYQEELRRCESTTVLTSGPGHAERCLDTPFAAAYRRQRRRLDHEGAAPETAQQVLEAMKLGRLRIAAKGVARNPDHPRDPQAPKLIQLGQQEQYDQGLYLIGQLAALRSQTLTMAALHEDIAGQGTAYLAGLEPPTAVTAGGGQREAPADIAIIGMACLLPRATSVAAYWQNILGKVNAIQEIPASRWDWRLYYDADRRARDRIYSQWGAFLDPIPFDPLKYGITPNSLPALEPLQLLVLEVSRQALEDAGYGARPFPRSRTAVILGISGSGELAQQYSFRTTLPSFLGEGELPEAWATRLPEWTEDSFPGILMNVAAGRIANRFDLGGLNCTVDAACASSLAAVHLAVRELESGSSDMALVGGADCMQSPFTYMCFSKTLALSSRQQPRCLDAEADGIVLGEGVVMLVLKRLADAERDGDTIYAVIKSAAASSDGRGKSLTAPDREGQVRALTRAYRKAGFSAATVGLIEAHATGTVVGDRTEIEALTQVFREAGAGEQTCAIGSVKSMIGHTKSAAGVASLLKAALALHHKVLPPTLGVTRPNPALEQPGTPFYVNREPRPWVRAAPEVPRRAGTSALGFGGTNFHVVLEEYCGDYLDRAAEVSWHEGPGELFLWSGGTRGEMVQQIEAVTARLSQDPRVSLVELALEVAHKRHRHGSGGPGADVRVAIVTASRDDLERKLSRAHAFLHGEEPDLSLPEGVYGASRQLAPPGLVAFLFPGQGSQYVDMFADLAIQFPVVREPFERATAILADHLPRPLSRMIFPPSAFQENDTRRQQEELAQTRVAQPAMGAADLAMFRFLKSLGVIPDMVAGHSYGELVALAAAGVLNEDDLFRLSEARARFILEAAGDIRGTMAAVNAGEEQVQEGLQGLTGVWMANLNGPQQTVITGTREAVEEAQERFRALGVPSRLLPVSCAFHSPLMDAARGPLREFLGNIPLRPPQLPVYGNATMSPYPTDSAAIIDRLTEHLVSQVRFAGQIEAMYAQGARLFVEVGPGRVLTGLVERILSDRPHLAVATNRPGRSGWLELCQAAGKLFVAGVLLKTDIFFQGRKVQRLDGTHPTGAGPGHRHTPTTWMVAGATVTPVGENAAGRRPAGPKATTGGNRDVPAIVTAPLESPGIPAHVWNRASPVDVSGFDPVRGADAGATQGPRSASGQTMLEYQRLCQRFLDTQKDIMLEYLRGQTEAAGGDVRQPASPTVVRALADVEGDLRTRAAEAGGQSQGVSVADEATEHRAISEKPLGADREALTRTLRQIVSERTGYPPEMLELHLDLEADLGIDSIKRVEILGQLLQGLFPAEQGGPPEAGTELHRLKTLGDILDRLGEWQEITPPRAVPPDQIFVPPAVAIRDDQGGEALPRFTLRAVAAPEPPRHLHLAPGRVVVLTDDGFGIAAALKQRLTERGVASFLLGDPQAVGVDYRVTDFSAPALAALVEQIRREQGAVGGLVHLLPLRPGPAWGDLTLSGWQERLQKDVGFLFQILKLLAGDLQEAAPQGAWVVAATGMGGRFACERDPKQGDFFPGHGGIPGLLKTVALEWPEIRVKSVDLALTEPVEGLADHLLAEIEADDGVVEVGYDGLQRYTLGLAAAPLVSRETNGLHLDPEAVVLVTGGARGITATVAWELAERHRPTLILAGRAPLPPPEEDPRTAGRTGPQELKAALIAERKPQGHGISIPEIDAAYDNLLKQREIRSNLARLRGTGARVSYQQVDVRDETAFAGLIQDLYRRYGRLDGVIHGAGVIEDKLLRDKSPESFQRVFATKTDSAFILGRALRPEGLKFLVLFSSVAGRFGNRGQADYTAANDIYNKLATYLDARWPGRVVALNWGPWKTSGMVSPQVQQQFEARGVDLIEPEAGSRSCDRELHYGRKGETEVVLGEGPWRRLAEAGDVIGATPLLDLPLLHGYLSCQVGPGGVDIVRRLDPKYDLYLEDHCLDGKPVLPAAVALEFMAEAARLALPEWQVAGLKDVRVFKGIVLEEDSREILIRALPPGSLTDPLELRVELKESAGRQRLCYQGTVVLTRSPMSQEPPPQPPSAEWQPFGWSVAEAYDTITFHGPRFQGITAIEGINDGGMAAILAPSDPGRCLAGAPPGQWLIDPVVVDCGLQLVLLWGRTHLDITLLPSRFRGVWIYRPLSSVPEIRARFQVERVVGHQTVYSYIYFFSPEGELLGWIDEVESTGSAALNRLAGVPKLAGGSRP